MRQVSEDTIKEITPGPGQGDVWQATGSSTIVSIME
jgi:hypothetical protein